MADPGRLLEIELTEIFDDASRKSPRFACEPCQFNFHALRHSCLQNAYRATRDIRLVQRLARHKSIDTTTIYAGPSDEELLGMVCELPC